MEALGGDAIWSDRFLGYHIAIGYYWALIVVFVFSPAVAYEFMEVSFHRMAIGTLYVTSYLTNLITAP